MKYIGRIYRPPSEASSVIIQHTVGCSHNRCSFCAMYRDKHFQLVPVHEVLQNLDEVARLAPFAHRFFIGDGDPLSAGFEPFAELCRHINERFPRLERISAYVNARDITRLSDDQLRALRDLKFSLTYLGLESGSANVLRSVHKGANPADMVDMAAKCHNAGIGVSVIVLLGAGGQALTEDHARGTTETLNAMQPEFLSFLTAMILPNTPLMAYVEEGRFQPLTDRAILLEAKNMLEGLELNSTLFRMNHVSNLIALGGRLPADKGTILAQLNALIPRATSQITCICTESEGLML